MPVPDNSAEEFTVRNSSGTIQLRFRYHEFICARSVENYIQIHYLQNGSLKTGMVRIPIAKFFEQVSNHKTIVRCHRSVVVNLSYIKQVSGRSRSLELFLEHLEEPVPVSREFPRDLL